MDPARKENEQDADNAQTDHRAEDFLSGRVA